MGFGFCGPLHAGGKDIGEGSGGLDSQVEAQGAEVAAEGPDDAVDAFDATSKTPTAEDEEDKDRLKATARKKQSLRKEKADAHKEHQAQLLLELVHYRPAEEKRRLGRDVEEAAVATAAAAAKGQPAADPCQPTSPLWHVYCLC